MPNCELCGEPMPPGEEMFKYHGYSGNCPKPPLPKPSAVREGAFHWKDGWMFARGESRQVHIWRTDSQGHTVELAIPQTEWDSILLHLAAPAPTAV